MKKNLTWAMTLISLLLCAVYFGFWFYSAHVLRQEIDRAYANAQKDGYEYLGPKPILSNFPFVPEITYQNGIRTGNLAILFPEMKLRGYPMSLAPLTVDFPKGLSVQGPLMDPALWSLDTLKISAIIPARLPADFTQESLTAWQQSGGQINITNISLQKQTLKAEGKGMVALDASLQPLISFEASAQGYQEFIVTQREAGYIKPFPAAAAAAVMNSLSTVSPTTGKSIVSMNVVVKDRMLSVGPIQALPLPEIVWDRRIRPAPLQ